VEGEAESRLCAARGTLSLSGVLRPFIANLSYWVRDRDRELACLFSTSSAWKMPPCDAWIGWSDERRKRNLQWIVKNGRVLILPWVRVGGLASKILALDARQDAAQLANPI
jgi:hypothetical protein